MFHPEVPGKSIPIEIGEEPKKRALPNGLYVMCRESNKDVRGAGHRLAHEELVFGLRPSGAALHPGTVSGYFMAHAAREPH
jgi:hypothetical protein